MAISERERRELHEAVGRGISARAADLLLAMTEPELPYVVHAEMAELRGEMAGPRGDLARQVPMLVLANIATIVGFGGLFVGAGAIL